MKRGEPAYLLTLLLCSAPLWAQHTALQAVAFLPTVLSESSGLAYTHRGLFSLGDNPSPQIYRIDPATGAVLQTIYLEGASFSDKEALAFDSTALYIGDFGNNKDARRDLRIIKVLFTHIGVAPSIRAPTQTITFHYPEQSHFKPKKKQRRFDCEAMVVVGDSLYLFTKQRSDHRTTLYALPKTPGTHAAQHRGEFDAQGLITSAALSPDGKTLLLLGYDEKHLNSFLWHFQNFPNQDFFAGTPQRKILTSAPEDWQTEALTFVDANTFLLTCERTPAVPATLYRGSLSVLFPTNPAPTR